MFQPFPFLSTWYNKAACVNETSIVPIKAIQPDLSESSKYLYGIMLSYGIKSYSVLESTLDCNEYRVHGQAVSKYAEAD